MKTSSRWLVCRARRPASRGILYCFPHAGGSAGEYARWSDDLAGVEVRALQVPGRGARLAEEPITRLVSIVDALLDEVQFEPPFTLFGHSFGALLAFEVARGLRSHGREQPARLLVSEAAPPHSLRPHPPLHELPDEELLVELERRGGGLPADVREYPEFLALALRSFRTDWQVLQSYRYVPTDPLDCPITALAATDSGGSTGLDMEGWRLHTRDRFELRWQSGGHFYIRERREPFLQLVSDLVSAGAGPEWS